MEGSQEEGSAALGRGGKSTAGPATMTSRAWIVIMKRGDVEKATR